MRNAASRQNIVSNLPAPILNQMLIGDSYTATTYIMAVVTACLEYPDGLQSLLQLVTFHDKGTHAYIELEQFLSTQPLSTGSRPSASSAAYSLTATAYSPANPLKATSAKRTTTPRGALRLWLENQFQHNDLLNFGFDLGFDYKQAFPYTPPPPTNNQLTRELIDFCNKDGSLSILISLALSHQPDSTIGQQLTTLLKADRKKVGSSQIPKTIGHSGYAFKVNPTRFLVEIDLKHDTLTGIAEQQAAQAQLTKAQLAMALAQWAAIPISLITILAIQPGSIRVLVSISTAGAERLFNSNIIGKRLNSFQVVQIRDFYQFSPQEQAKWRQLYEVPTIVLPPGRGYQSGIPERKQRSSRSSFLPILLVSAFMLSAVGTWLWLNNSPQASPPVVASPNNLVTPTPILEETTTLATRVAIATTIAPQVTTPSITSPGVTTSAVTIPAVTTTTAVAKTTAQPVITTKAPVTTTIAVAKTTTVPAPDTTGPSISGVVAVPNPVYNQPGGTLCSQPLTTLTFKAQVSDPSGVLDVTVSYIYRPGGAGTKSSPPRILSLKLIGGSNYEGQLDLSQIPEARTDVAATNSSIEYFINAVDASPAKNKANSPSATIKVIKCGPG